MTREETLRILRSHWEPLQDQFGVRSLSVYGSIAHDEASAASDVDLLVEFNGPAGYFQIGRLQQFLEEILGCNVDLNTPASLRESIRQQVHSEAIRVD